MKGSSKIPLVFWRVMSRLNQKMLSHYGPKSKTAGRVLVLTTIGRKTGKSRQTPLQYEEIEGVYYVTSARGVQADWYCNIIANPQVDVQVGGTIFSTTARPITDPGQIADFLELRLKRHPYFMGAMLRLEGLPRKHSRKDLKKFAERLVIVALVQETAEIMDMDG
jgi:deazaflavin-dependent oxidoreductase (nitroreductase family)